MAGDDEGEGRRRRRRLIAALVDVRQNVGVVLAVTPGDSSRDPYPRMYDGRPAFSIDVERSAEQTPTDGMVAVAAHHGPTGGEPLMSRSGRLRKRFWWEIAL